MQRRRLQALQVEVTSRCTRRCALCPRSSLGHIWHDGDLPDAAWERLRGELGLARHVHLQGWGEPLLDPRLPTMVHDAHTAGCAVGLTTNGDLMDDAVPWLVAGELDLLTVSIAGQAAGHRLLRDGSDLGHVWAAVSLVASRRRRRRPRLKASYLLTRDTLDELVGAVADAAAAGVDELFVIHLDCVTNSFQHEARAFSPEGVPDEVVGAVADARRVARRVGLDFRAPALEPSEKIVCDLDPRSLLSVDHRGQVGPCAYLTLPVEGTIPRWTTEGVVEITPVRYGSLLDEPLSSIIDGPSAKAFCAPLRARVQAHLGFLEAAIDLPMGVRGLRRLEVIYEELEAELERSPFPSACRGCYKVHGW